MTRILIGDDVPNEEDNCPLIANPDQSDSDGDGEGDACDDSDTDTFDEEEDLAGWTTSGDAENLRHVADGGNPGGAICADDMATGIYWYFRTPYTGDLSAFYGGTLSYDILSDADETMGMPGTPPSGDVVISGAGMTIAYFIAETIPNDGTWVSIEIPLSATGWVLQGTTDTIDEAEMQAILAAVDFIDIAGEYFVGPDTGCLDNVSLSGTADSGDGDDGGEVGDGEGA